MRLFKRKKEQKEPPRQEFCDIPIGSMVELSDPTTFALEEKVTKTYEVKAYKKYEAKGFLRYLYQLFEEEEVILGVDVDPDTYEYDLARFVIDSEEEFTEPLGDTILMEFDDPDNEGKTIPVEYSRNSVYNTNMTVVTPDGVEEHPDVELQDNWFTFYLGEAIEKTEANVFPIKVDEEE